MGLITLVLFYLFGKGVVFKILYYSAFVIFCHAFMRDFEQIAAAAEGYQAAPAHSYQAQDTELNL